MISCISECTVRREREILSYSLASVLNEGETEKQATKWRGF